jgi:tRNA-specific 2-thiouridylase
LGHRERVLVAMSGGVDSSVAAALLREQGHDVVGVTLHLWDAEGASKVGRCCAPEDRDDARRACDALGVPHYVIDEREAFRAEVVDPFVAGYRAGITPSPCIACNQHVKLGRLAALADALSCASIATGHYARLERDPATGDPVLLRGCDPDKDQSYFLYGVPRSILSRMVFPLGALTKGETRAEGKRLGVPGWDKKDSQELCFVPDGNVAGFVERTAPIAAAPPESRSTAVSGRIVDDTGAEIAQHHGVHHFTVGQRRGLGLPGPASDGKPRYVLRIVEASGDVIVGPEAGLYSAELAVEGAAWIGEPPRGAFDGEVQIRHHHAAAKARIEPDAQGFVARFEIPQRAVAPGQAAVVYVGPRVVGGGTIRRLHG